MTLLPAILRWVGGGRARRAACAERQGAGDAEADSAKTGSVATFLAALAAHATAAGQGSYAFPGGDGTCRGFVQFIVRSDHRIEIHRLWALQPRRGSGSAMLRALCDLADSHGIEIALKALPFGRKPYPFSRHELADWYQRHGFRGTHKKMVRAPRDV